MPSLGSSVGSASSSALGAAGFPYKAIGKLFGNIAPGVAALSMPNYKNPSDAAMPYVNQIPGMISPYFNENVKKYYEPYSDLGQKTLGSLEERYEQLERRPDQFLNEIGAGYQQSPGLQFAIQQALQGAGHAAAAGGFAGSPMHEQQNMELATNLANQDYNQWIQNALGLFGQGVAGKEAEVNRGYMAGGNIAEAGKDYGTTLGNMQLQKALLSYLGRQGENLYNQDRMKAIGSGAGGVLSWLGEL